MISPVVKSSDLSSSLRAFVCPQARPQAEKRLFLFPHAGGSAASFVQWNTSLPDHLESWVAYLPGRGSRSREAPHTGIAPLVEELTQAIEPLLDKPSIFFGHSLGGLIAFELARQLRRCNLPQPSMLFVSACSAPHQPHSRPLVHALSDEEFLDELKKFNNIPDEILRESELMDLVLPSLRADVQAFETYIYSPEAPLDFPIIAFGGIDDPRVSRGQLEAWAIQTNSSFKSEYFPGDHFFINTARDLVIASIVTELKD